MYQLRSVASGLILSAIVMLSGPVYAKLSLTDKVLLQSAMQQHVERSMVGGAFLHLDAASGGVRALHQEEAHPMILRMGKYFVLCASFRDDDGEHVNVDFYLAPHEKSYVVFQSLVEDREILQHLMKKGDAVRVN